MATIKLPQYSKSNPAQVAQLDTSGVGVVGQAYQEMGQMLDRLGTRIGDVAEKRQQMADETWANERKKEINEKRAYEIEKMQSAEHFDKATGNVKKGGKVTKQSYVNYMKRWTEKQYTDIEKRSGNRMAWDNFRALDAGDMLSQVKTDIDYTQREMSDHYRFLLDEYSRESATALRHHDPVTTGKSYMQFYTERVQELKARTARYDRYFKPHDAQDYFTEQAAAISHSYFRTAAAKGDWLSFVAGLGQNEQAHKYITKELSNLPHVQEAMKKLGIAKLEAKITKGDPGRKRMAPFVQTIGRGPNGEIYQFNMDRGGFEPFNPEYGVQMSAEFVAEYLSPQEQAGMVDKYLKAMVGNASKKNRDIDPNIRDIRASAIRDIHNGVWRENRDKIKESAQSLHEDVTLDTTLSVEEKARKHMAIASSLIAMDFIDRNALHLNGKKLVEAQLRTLPNYIREETFKYLIDNGLDASPFLEHPQFGEEYATKLRDEILKEYNKIENLQNTDGGDLFSKHDSAFAETSSNLVKALESGDLEDIQEARTKHQRQMGITYYQAGIDRKNWRSLPKAVTDPLIQNIVDSVQKENVNSAQFEKAANDLRMLSNAVPPYEFEQLMNEAGGKDMETAPLFIASQMDPDKSSTLLKALSYQKQEGKKEWAAIVKRQDSKVKDAMASNEYYSGKIGQVLDNNNYKGAIQYRNAYSKSVKDYAMMLLESGQGLTPEEAVSFATDAVIGKQHVQEVATPHGNYRLTISEQEMADNNITPDIIKKAGQSFMQPGFLLKNVDWDKTIPHLAERTRAIMGTLPEHMRVPTTHALIKMKFVADTMNAGYRDLDQMLDQYIQEHKKVLFHGNPSKQARENMKFNLGNVIRGNTGAWKIFETDNARVTWKELNALSNNLGLLEYEPFRIGMTWDKHNESFAPQIYHPDGFKQGMMANEEYNSNSGRTKDLRQIGMTVDEISAHTYRGDPEFKGSWTSGWETMVIDSPDEKKFIQGMKE
jgi:hypothetical protein